MWNKIFAAALLIAFLSMSFLTYYAASWLGSIGSPADALVGFEWYASLGLAFLWLSSLMLLILANVVLWVDRRSWPLWTTLLYFVLFLALRSFWLDPASYDFAATAGRSISSKVGVLLTFITITAAVAVIYVNQMVVMRMADGIAPRPTVPEPEPASKELKVLDPAIEDPELEPSGSGQLEEMPEMQDDAEKLRDE